MLFDGPISMLSFSTTSRKNSFLLYLIPSGLHETILEICVGILVGTLVFYDMNGLNGLVKA
jgi:hypothetical protein